jgi:hypothetical protein
VVRLRVAGPILPLRLLRRRSSCRPAAAYQVP